MMARWSVAMREFIQTGPIMTARQVDGFFGSTSSDRRTWMFGARARLYITKQKPDNSAHNPRDREPFHYYGQQDNIDRGPLKAEAAQLRCTIHHPVPAGMRDERRQNDRSHSRLHNKPEQEIERGDQESQHH